MENLKLNEIEEYNFFSNENPSSESEFLFKKLKKYPFIDYNNDASEFENYIDKFIDYAYSFLRDFDVSGLNLLFFELLINIYIHSEFKNAYVFCQRLFESYDVAVCIIDDGITIPGSLEDCGYSFSSDSNAIFEAINGCSSDKWEE